MYGSFRGPRLECVYSRGRDTIPRAQQEKKNTMFERSNVEIHDFNINETDVLIVAITG